MTDAANDSIRIAPLQVAVRLAAAALPLVCWPDLPAPFSSPKRWLLCGTVAVLLPVLTWRVWRSPSRASTGADVAPSPVAPGLQLVLAVWLASFAGSALAAPDVSPEALLLGVVGPLWGLVVALAAMPVAALSGAHVAGTAAMACIAISQWAGADPIGWLGWTPGVEGGAIRLRVYGTLGNPNFVAALAAITIPLACARAIAQDGGFHRRLWAGVAVVVLATGLVVTGSRAGALGLASGVAVFGMMSGHRRSRLLALGAVLVAALAMAGSGARGLADTSDGRVYIWKTAWSHAWDRPWAGLGPGAFELHYPGWDRRAQAAGEAGSADLRFAGPQQAAHNDYLQSLLERGVPGLVAFLLAVATPAMLWRRSRLLVPETRAAVAGAAGAIAAGATVALFDFPFQRPAETAALFMALALAWQSASLASVRLSPIGELSP
ncbi:MAG: O-antigen ligase family protein [Acidobacteriota bacterium]